MTSKGRGVAALVVLALAIAAGTAGAEQSVSHAARLEGSPPQFAALGGFDPGFGELLRVRLEISGTASGAEGYYGATGKQFTYRGRFALADSANPGPRGPMGSVTAHGVDSAPPSPDSLAAVD